MTLSFDMASQLNIHVLDQVDTRVRTPPRGHLAHLQVYGIAVASPPHIASLVDVSIPPIVFPEVVAPPVVQGTTQGQPDRLEAWRLAN